MSTLKEKITVMTAALEGKRIQFKDRVGNSSINL